MSSSVGENFSKNINNVGNVVNQGAQNVSETVGNVRDNINTTLQDFSKNVSKFSTKEFLESNTIIAKFVFLILVLIVFLIFMNLGIYLITKLTAPNTSPYVVPGINDGNDYKIITQDPKLAQSVTIFRSNNESTGIEFTWSVWLKIIKPNTGKMYNHVFSKGGYNDYDNNGIMKINNGPGMYIVTTQAGTLNPVPQGYTGSTQSNLKIFMNVAATNPTSDIDTITESITVSGVPMGVWFNTIIRLENKVMDVYINGTITQRHVFTNVPIQNYDDVYVCGNGGFYGKLSDLRYFNRALNVFEINNIVGRGPSLYETGSKDTTSQMSFLWYNTNANV